MTQFVFTDSEYNFFKNLLYRKAQNKPPAHGGAQAPLQGRGIIWYNQSVHTRMSPALIVTLWNYTSQLQSTTTRKLAKSNVTVLC